MQNLYFRYNKTSTKQIISEVLEMNTMTTLQTEKNQWVKDVLAYCERERLFDFYLDESHRNIRDISSQPSFKAIEQDIVNTIGEGEEKTPFNSLKAMSALTDVIEKLIDVLAFINPQDFDMDYKEYRISLNNYNSEFYSVYGMHEQDALDTLVDYLEEKGYMGYFVTDEDGIEHTTTAGNHCLQLEAEHVSIQEIKKELKK